jgi:hypothetical protein
MTNVGGIKQAIAFEQGVTLGESSASTAGSSDHTLYLIRHQVLTAPAAVVSDGPAAVFCALPKMVIRITR